jgi:predicted permease
MQIINLGSSITAKRVESEQLAMRQSSVIFVLLARLVAVPMLSIGTTQLLLHTGALSRDNPHMLLVLMIESSTPTAMQIMVMCQLWHQRAEGMLGGLFVRSYLLSLVTVTFWTGTVLFLLGTTDGDGDAAAG